jgi:transcriptional regulator GlxA family with amidase domain
MRLQKARDLLEGSYLSIKEVAVHVGLNPSRFSKSFRETHGVTPLQYRSAASRNQSNPACHLIPTQRLVCKYCSERCS